jgi:hypothetical protein
LSSPTVDHILTDVGMNPFRPHKRRASDYVMVVAAFVICALLVAWAIHG